MNSPSLLPLLLLLLLPVAFAFSQAKPPVAPDNYAELWKQVEAFRKKGLTASATGVVEKIYARAKKENNTPQYLKALVFRLNLLEEKEEEPTEKKIALVQQELQTASFPAQPLLQSLLAGQYGQYLRQNRYRIYNRTATTEPAPDDVRTWNLEQLTGAIIRHHLLALAEPERLQQAPLGTYGELIASPDSAARRLRPTLYDFLAHRAIDDLQHDELYLRQPAQQFQVNNPAYFFPAADFAKRTLSSPDSLSQKFYVLQLLQDLTRFRLQDKNLAALADVELKRLAFVHENSILPDRHLLYLRALQEGVKRYEKLPISTEFMHEAARQLEHDPALENHLPAARQLCLEAIRRFPKSLGAQQCQAYIREIEEVALGFQVEENLLPNQPFLSRITYRNLTQVSAKAFRISEQQHYTWGGHDHYYDEEKEVQKLILNRKPTAQWEVQLPDEQDFLSHAVQAKANALPLGHYLVVLSAGDPKINLQTKKKPINYAFVAVTNLSPLHRQRSVYEGDLLVLHRQTGLPLAEVKVQPIIREYDTKKRENVLKNGEWSKTEQQGKTVVKIPEFKGPNSYGYYPVHQLRLTLPGDTVRTQPYFQSRRHSPEPTDPTACHLFTDRAIYRPGQTLYYKGILLKREGETAAVEVGKKVTVELLDVNEEVVLKHHFETNAFGSFSGSLVLPRHLLNGQMQLKTEHGRVSFSVEDYKRPTFEVAFAPVPAAFRLGDTIRVKGTAQAYAGPGLDSATVAYRVVRQVGFPYWWEGGSYHEETTMTHGTVRTGSTGEFEVAFPAWPDSSVARTASPTFRFTVSADVTDGSGETQSNEQTVSVGYVSLVLNTDLPGQVNREKETSYTLTATNLAGEKQAVPGILRLYRLTPPDRSLWPRLWEKPDRHLLTEAEFRRDFSKDVYAAEDDRSTWPKTLVREEAFDTGKNPMLPQPLFRSLEQGAYELELTTRDPQGEEVKTTRSFTLFSPAEKALPVPTPDLFVLLTEKAEPGQQVSFLIGSSEENVRVLYEVEHRGRIIQSEWLTLHKEQKKVDLPVQPEWRGNVGLHLTFVRDNRLYSHQATLVVPYPSRELNVAFTSFRSKLQPGEKEQWTLTIRGSRKEQVAAEMLATLYDASLDAFRPHQWHFPLGQRQYQPTLSWAGKLFDTANGEPLFYINNYMRIRERIYPYVRWYDNGGRGYGRRVLSYSSSMEVADQDMLDATGAVEGVVMTKSAPQATQQFTPPIIKRDEQVVIDQGVIATEGAAAAPKPLPTRKNFSETAFFLPHLRTNEQGEIVVQFTVPEALTRWKMLGLAHTLDLQYGLVQNELVTQKELMVTPNAPRFLREGDRLRFSAKVANLSANTLKGTAQLQFFDAFTQQPLDQSFRNNKAVRKLEVPAQGSTVVAWDVEVPAGLEAVTYKVVAQAGNFSDGEERALPVLSNRMLVTEALPLPVRGGQTKTYRLDKLLTSTSPTLQQHQLTVEFTQNPAWYAVQALPYLMEFPHECAEQIFSRLYANLLAAHIAQKNPQIWSLFDRWQKTAGTPGSLVANLQKNEDLKALLLQETPWVAQGKSEAENQRRLGLLFDAGRLAAEQEKAVAQLQRMQLPDGSWPWFAQGPSDRYITQVIVTGLGRLQHLGVLKLSENEPLHRLARQAMAYLDQKLAEDYQRLKSQKNLDLKKQAAPSLAVQYLYARSFFPELPVAKAHQPALDYFRQQAASHWLQHNRYLQGMIALALHRAKQPAVAGQIMASLKENALQSEEMGMYWKDVRGGYYWQEAPVETQALLIEAFSEVTQDKAAMEEMKVWLLKQKQTQDWKTTRATADACYALLLRGTDWLVPGRPVRLSLGGTPVPTQGPEHEPGPGYFLTFYAPEQIKKEMGEVKVQQPGEGVAWGALYWQYFEQLDKITPAQTPLQLQKKLYRQRATDRGVVLEPVTEKTMLQVGDLLTVRVELRSDRDMEYLHLKDMRAAGLEPVSVLSRHKWQGGLGYYESTRDAATHFFLSWLPKGTHVFEYALRVAQTGDFSNGITTIQCMYAPEFTSHSEGLRLKVGR